MAIEATASKVIELAKKEEDYLEKRSNSQLDDKTCSKIYTKRARNLNNYFSMLNSEM